MQSGKFIDFSKFCKCDMLWATFYFVAVYNSAVIEFWSLLLEQRIKLVLISNEVISGKKITKISLFLMLEQLI